MVVWLRIRTSYGSREHDNETANFIQGGGCTDQIHSDDTRISGCCTVSTVGRDSVCGIATRYGLHSPGTESRWKARFSAPAQASPESHPASYKISTDSFPGVKRPGTHPHLTPKLKSRAIFPFRLWSFMACYRVNFIPLSFYVGTEWCPHL